jgi:antitoxin (DNA-binding transcriptional repressor) of toxin-antitoxin stability system
MEIAAGKFKAKCLKILEEVGEIYPEITITKRGIPMAKLIPIGNKSKVQYFGCAKETIIFKGDLLSPINEKWSGDEG